MNNTSTETNNQQFHYEGQVPPAGFPGGQYAAPAPAPNAVQEHCTTCSAPMGQHDAACSHCGTPRLVGRQYCWHCATPVATDQALCTTCGAGIHGSAGRAVVNNTVQSKRVMAGVVAIFVGAFGIHKFVIGDSKQGLIRLGVLAAAMIFTLGFGALALMVIGVIEGVTYLTMTDADFIRIYQEGHKEWF